MEPRNNEYMTIAEAAKILRTSKHKIKNLAKKGVLTSHPLGKLLYIERRSVEYLAKQWSFTAPEGSVDRRAFLALGKVIGLAGINGWVFFMYKKLEKLEPSSANLEQSEVEIEDLFPMWPDVQVVPGSHHPVDGYHPDIQIALERLTPLVPRIDPIVTAGADALPPADLSRDLVLIGGPVSNVISLSLHGYKYTGDKISVSPERNTGLRWCFHYPFPSDDDLPYSRYVDGKLRTTMPKALVDTHASGYLAKPQFCKTDPQGRIEFDYLLLTVVPNSIRSNFTGSTIIDVADLQGQGDKVFADVLRDSASISELAEAVNGKRYFQALYEVPVAHDDSQCATTPATPRLLDVHLLA